MGSCWSAVVDRLNGVKRQKVLILGLDAAGKTTILYRLKWAETVGAIPTIGWNIEKVQYKKIEFDMWDVGGEKNLRPFWQQYYNNVRAVIFVVDAADRERLHAAQELMHDVIGHHLLQDAALLVFANKQDLPNTASSTELTEDLQLEKIIGRTWYIQSCCATSGEGLYDGLDWLAMTLNK